MLRSTILLLPFLFQTAPASPRVGFSGAEVYAQTCALCHSTGSGGAPRLGHQDEWQGRLGSGRADLLRSVLRGKGGMPPKGGNASLSTSDANAALDYLLARSAGR